MSCCAVLKAAKYEKQLSWCYVSPSSPCPINSLSVANINRKTVNFEQQILALLLVHQTAHNLSCITFAHISRPVEVLCISWSCLKAYRPYRLKPSMLGCDKSNLESGLKNATGATVDYNVRVTKNTLRYNLQLPWRTKDLYLTIRWLCCFNNGTYKIHLNPVCLDLKYRTRPSLSNI